MSDVPTPNADTEEIKLRRGDKLVIASHNKGKLREFAELLRPYGVDTVSASDLALPEPEETGQTFEANALIKAFAAAHATGLPALADDSGIEVAMLDGAPGIYSARWGGPSKDFAMAMQRIHDEVCAKADWSAISRRANFNATLVIAWPSLTRAGSHRAFAGKVYGDLQWPPRGNNGFGYDPMFQPDGSMLTYGEMTAAQKHSHDDGRGGGPGSHRARALRLFVEASVDGVGS